MTARTVRVETELVGYDAGSYVTVDDSVPLIAALISRGYLTVATPPTSTVATGPGPLSGLTLGDLTSPSSPASVALKAAYVAGRACSTDGTNSLPTPTGAGLEFVITATGLQDICFNGASL